MQIISEAITAGTLEALSKQEVGEKLRACLTQEQILDAVAGGNRHERRAAKAIARKANTRHLAHGKV